MDNRDIRRQISKTTWTVYGDGEPTSRGIRKEAIKLAYLRRKGARAWIAHEYVGGRYRILLGKCEQSNFGSNLDD